MADLIEAMPRRDQRLIDQMAAAANTTPQALILQIAREYLNLVRSAPAALPNNPLKDLSARNLQRGG